MTVQASSKLTGGKLGNSSRGIPRSLNRDRPHSRLTRCSPEAVIRMAALGSSRTMSTSFLAGTVTAPSASTSAGTTVLTAMSRSVPDRRTPSAVASIRILESIGRVVLVGTLAATATNPSCKRSRVIVNFIWLSSLPSGEEVYNYSTRLINSSTSRGSGNLDRLAKHFSRFWFGRSPHVSSLYGLWTGGRNRDGYPHQPHPSTTPSTGFLRNPHQLASRVVHPVAELVVAGHHALHLVQAVYDR